MVHVSSVLPSIQITHTLTRLSWRTRRCCWIGRREERRVYIYLMSPRNIDLGSCSTNLSAFSPCLTQVFFHTSLEAVFLIFFSSISFSSLCPRVLREPQHRRAILGDVGVPLALGVAALSQGWERHLVVDVGSLLAASTTLKCTRNLFKDVLDKKRTMTSFLGISLRYYLARHHPPLGVICPYLIVITE